MSKKKTNNIKDLFCIIMVPITIIYFSGAVISIICGIYDSGSDYRWKREKCEEPLSRYEYVFPFYRLGCWLGEVPEEKTCDKTTEN